MMMYRNRSMKIAPPQSRLFKLLAYEDETKEEKEAREKAATDAAQKLVDDKVAKATEGLKNTNTALKLEKTAVKEQLEALTKSFDALGGADGVKALMEQQSKLRETAEGQLLADGKHQEWYDLKTAAARKDHENQLAAKDTQFTELTSQRDGAVSELARMRLQVDVSQAMLEAKTRTDVPALHDDVVNAAEKLFTYDPGRTAMVIKDKDEGVVFGKDGSTPKTVAEWLTEQQETHRHWWGDSVSGGAKGSELGNAGEKNPWSKDHWNVTAQGQYVRTHGAPAATKLAEAAGSKLGATSPTK